jgi:transcription elongation factor Elf1
MSVQCQSILRHSFLRFFQCPVCGGHSVPSAPPVPAFRLALSAQCQPCGLAGQCLSQVVWHCVHHGLAGIQTYSLVFTFVCVFLRNTRIKFSISRIHHLGSQSFPAPLSKALSERRGELTRAWFLTGRLTPRAPRQGRKMQRGVDPLSERAPVHP